MMVKTNKTVHLVHISPRPGGIEVLLPVMINALPEWDFEALVIRKFLPGDQNVYDLLNNPVVYGSNNNLKALYKTLIYALKYRKDIFQVFNIGPVFLFVFRIVGVKRLIYSIHGTVYWKTRWKKIFLKLFWKLALCKHYRITSNSEYSRKVFLEKISQKASIKVLYNPINVNRFTPWVNTNETGNLKIIYAGRLSKGKNLETWIDIACQIHKSLPATRFGIYGSGPLYESLLVKVKATDSSNFIFLKGFRHDMENVYREADLLLFLSEYESFGNVAVESILCGTPALVSDIPSMREIFMDFPGFIVKSDVSLFHDVYNNLLNIKTLKERALKARESFMQRFSTEAHVEILNKLYKSFGA